MKDFVKNLESGFFAFWVNKYKVSFILILAVLILGIGAIIQIPKESSPNIEIPILQITTTYQGVNADDIDSLITDKIVRGLNSINGIKQIDATSSLGLSVISLELNDNINPKEKLIDVQDEIDKISFPSDADEPTVSNITTENQLIFNLVIYSQIYSQDELKEKARQIRDNLEGKNGLSKIEILGSADYEYKINVKQGILDQIGLSVSDIGQTIRSYDSNFPLGNYTVGNSDYDFRIDGEFEEIDEIMNLIVHGQDSSYVKLSDIADYHIEYEDDNKRFVGLPENNNIYNSVVLSFEKNQQTDIFNASSFAKSEIESLFETNDFNGIEYLYTSDLASTIIKDYKSLAKNGGTTVFLVFILLLIFVGFKQSLLATLILPLSFLITFFVLDALGLTMNFLTNFSLVLSFGIAIDVIIVIIEGASEKLKLGYSNKNAILLAIKDLNKPMISGAATTLGAFLPLMFLPGMLGTFLAYIPITVFCIVISALVLSLTLNSAVFYKLNGNSKYYTPNEFSEDLLSDNEKKILENDRESKQVKIGFKGLNTIVFDGLKNFYILLLNFILKYRFNRILVIIIPFLLLILTFFTISSKIGFTIFPNSDTDSMQINIEGKKGLTSDYMLKYTENFDQVFNNILEIKDYSYNINGNKISIDINLLSVEKRRDLGMNSVFEVESKIIDKFSYLTLQGLEVKTSIQSGGPPSGSPVGVRIVTDDIKYFDDLLTISKKFEDWLAGQDSILSTSISSDELPGQYVLKYKDFALNEFGLSPDRVSNEIFTYLNGQNVSSIRKGKDSFDVIIKSNKFGDEINPSNIMNINVGKVNVGEIADVSLGRAVDSIQRRDNDIIVNVDGELKRGEESRTQEIQSKFVEFAKNYNYPDGIYFQEAGEGQENKELIVATIISFIIALLIIFSVLVLQFDSYLQPLMILYSIVMAMLGVNIGLWVTGNPYSMPFAIGFISLTGIVVNNAIILIDRMNNNLEQTNNKIDAIIEAGRSRLTPILLTTLTTIFGILPLALEDEFWAGLGFTVIFGLSFSSIMTLFVIPSIYYELFVNKKNKNKNNG